MNYLKLALVLTALAGCSPSEEGTLQPEQAGNPNHFKPGGDVKYMMQWVLDPAADHVWDSSGSIITAAGTRELAPTTDEGWLAVQHSAAVVAETGNLLLLPSLTKDDKAWKDIAQGLIDAGLRAKAAAAAQDDEALFDAGGQIYRVCKSCHSIYVQDEDVPTP